MGELNDGRYTNSALQAFFQVLNRWTTFGKHARATSVPSEVLFDSVYPVYVEACGLRALREDPEKSVAFARLSAKGAITKDEARAYLQIAGLKQNETIVIDRLQAFRVKMLEPRIYKRVDNAIMNEIEQYRRTSERTAVRQGDSGTDNGMQAVSKDTGSRFAANMSAHTRRLGQHLEREGERERDAKDAYWDEKVRERRDRKLRAGEEVMETNPYFRNALQEHGWSESDIRLFTSALGVRKLYAESSILKELEGGIIWGFNKAERDIVKRGMKIIRAHIKELERIERGRAKMSLGEKEALEKAIRGNLLNADDARDYAAMRAGWFGGVHYSPFRYMLHNRIRRILGPVWEVERASQDKRTNGERGEQKSVEIGGHSRKSGGDTSVGSSADVKQHSKDLISGLTPIQLRMISLAEARGDIASHTLSELRGVADGKVIIASRKVDKLLSDIREVIA